MNNRSKHESRHERLLSLTDAAEILGCSLKTIRRRVDAGDLAVIRDGRLVRIQPDDLDRYIRNHRIG